MELDRIINADQVIFLKNNEKQQAIRELISVLEKKGKINSTPRYYAQVIHRESLENTGIGNGLAIPHARTDSVETLNFVFGIAPDGIDYQSYDGKPVKYILLCIFPTTLSTEYLFLVSMLAKIFLLDVNRKKLENAHTPIDVYSVLIELFNSYYETISEKPSTLTNQTSNLAGVPNSDLDLIIKLDRLYRLFDEDKNNELLTKIDEIKKLIDKRSLTYYEKMRSKCLEPFAIVEKKTCSGCHMNIPEEEIDEIMKRNKISICSYCGRFLIVL